MKRINLQLEREPRLEGDKGVEFFVSVSPYFFPESLCYQYLNDSGELEIEFQYPNDEPGVHVDGDNLVSLVLGKTTKKILSVRIKVERNNIGNVKMMVSTHVEKALQEKLSAAPDMKPNYDAAIDAMSTHADEFAELATA